jgi:DNA-binding transcriptional LysR family regulator
MNLSQFEVFVAIVETGSFTEAANRVGLTRSAASHAVANLEAELGIALLERERGSVSPTTAGNCILQNAREILSNIETIRQEAASARGLQMGKLRVGIVSSISPTAWNGVLRKFRQEYSGIEVVTFEGSGYEVEDWILSSVVDVGFVLRGAEGIDSAAIGRDEVRVIVPISHALRKQAAVRLEQIAHEPFILPKIACDFLQANWHGVQHIELQRRYEASEVHTILAMVREGLGITMLPEMLLPTHVEGLHLLSLNPPLRFTFGVGVRASRNVSPAARMFILSAQSWAQSNGYKSENLEEAAFTDEAVQVEAAG